MAIKKNNSFSDIIGHQPQIRVLKSCIQKGQFNHTYLFLGAPNLGKKEIAWRFIGNILGLDSREEIVAHPDFQTLPVSQASSQKEEHNKIIKIDAIRQLKRHLIFKPYLAHYKIAFLPEAERMNDVAANALLKFLEEPSGESILILTATDKSHLLPTIISRCQVFQFYPVVLERITKFLESKGASRERAKFLASLSRGRPGIALSYFNNPRYLEKEISLVQDIISLRKEALFSRLAFAQKHSKDLGLENILKVWLVIFHDLLLAKNGCLELITHSILKEDILKLSSEYTQVKIKFLIRLIQKILQMLKNNVNRRLALEVLLINI